MHSISYNPLTRTYDLVESGSIVESFPAGDVGRQQARETAIKANDPRAYAAAFYLVNDVYRHRQELHGRIWSAAEILAENRLTGMNPIHDQPNSIARVNPRPGKNPLPAPEGDAYTIGRQADDVYACTCPDYQFRNAPRAEARNQPLCKHIIAFKLTRIMRRDIPPAPRINIDPEPWADERPFHEIDHERWSNSMKALRKSQQEEREYLAYRAAEINGVPEEMRPGKPRPRIRRRSLEEINALLYD